MRISSFCTGGLLTADATDTLLEAARKMARHHVGALAVLEEGELVGVISQADLVTAIAEGASVWATAVEDYMTEGAITVAPDEGADLAARRMVEHSIGHLPVVEAGSAVGMVSRGDLLAVGAVARPYGL